MHPQYFDAHSHVNDAQFSGDAELVLARMSEQSVWSLVVGTDRKMSEDAVTLATQSDGIFAAIGLHPTDNEHEGFDTDFYRELAKNPKVRAIGECGLDYSRVPEEKLVSEKVRQLALFESHIEIAVTSGLPLMIHCRDAHSEMLDILASHKRELGDALYGNIHFFSEGPDVAKKYFDLDFTISFTGVLTFARNYDETVRYAPLERLLSETDCPYVAPVPYRGKRNEPVYVQEVVKAIANIRNEDFEKVREVMVKNAFKAFGIVDIAPPPSLPL